MKAVIHEKYGPPEEVLELRETEKPKLVGNRVLVRIRATSVNPADYHPMRGMMLARVMGRTGLRKPKDGRFGSDFAGVVAELGEEPSQFKVGDEVYGVVPGAAAEYGAAREDRIALKPSNSTFEEAAAVPIAAFTALQAVRDKAKVKAGQKVLVNGASGGVGTFAVQIAKSYGAEVTAVTSTRNQDLVRKIGADRSIDYTQQDFTKTGEKYDVIIDTIGNHSVRDIRHSLTPDGRCVSIGFGGMAGFFGHIIVGSLSSAVSSKKVGFFVAKSNSKDLEYLKDLIEQGKVKPVVDRVYKMKEIADAVRYVEGPNHRPGHARGKVVVTID